jgi:hypothetical protein
VKQMPILNDNLSVWEIAFRWGGLDPRSVRWRIPLCVRDTFRNLMDAILQGHLYCDTLALEKWSQSTGDDPKSYIRYWLDDINDCIQGIHFSRKLLKWASIDRWAMQLWCERREIPLPEFWFPPGWGLEYKWPEEMADEERVQDASLPLVRNEKSPESSPILGSVPSPAPAQEIPSFTAPETQVRGKRALDRRQRGEIACQEVAKRYWKKHPDALLKVVAASSEVQEIAPGSDFQLEVVQRWLGPVDPRNAANRRGPKRRKM